MKPKKNDLSESARRATAIDLFVGQKLHAMRKSAGVSQTALGEKVGISFQQIQKYERGQNRISASRLWEFSIIFGVKPGAFYEGLDVIILENTQSADIEGREKLYA